MRGAAWTRRAFCGAGIGLALACPAWAQPKAVPVLRRKPETVRIGLVGSLFREVPEAFVRIAMEPSRQFFEAQMGVRSVLVNGGAPVEMGKSLKEDDLHVAVFHGTEFGWAKARYPKLKPLFIAVNVDPSLRAVLLVNKASTVKRVEDLRGKKLVMPARSREHCHMFVEQRVVKPGSTPFKHFSRVEKPGGSAATLDVLAEKKAAGAVVDGIDWDVYKRDNPANARKLKELLVSEPLPCAVVAAYGDNVDPSMLDKFKEGMLEAHKVEKGKAMLGIMRITHFAAVPDDYDKQVEAAAKAYSPKP
ncbi:MAG: PhnD/SsuA/transferrin family substrate-binding protein [Gemmataceae bacterium]|nr:PhnD/SsuA/transferrin family substrate-binding protein [Gemmataceae bacterium]